MDLQIIFQKRLGSLVLLNDCCPTEPVDASQAFPRPTMETLFKDHYFESGSGIGTGSDIERLFKDPPLEQAPLLILSFYQSTYILQKSLE